MNNENGSSASRQQVCNKTVYQMFDLVKSSVDRALRTVGVFYYQGSEFRVTRYKSWLYIYYTNYNYVSACHVSYYRHEYSPVTLKIYGPGASFFSVDLVPSLQCNFK